MSSQQDAPFCEAKDNGEAVIHTNLHRGPWANRVPEETRWDHVLNRLPKFLFCGLVICLILFFFSYILWG